MDDKEKELKEFKIEQQVLEMKTEAYKNSMVEGLLRSKLGDEIRETLRNPIKITKFKLFRMKLKSFMKRLFDAL